MSKNIDTIIHDIRSMKIRGANLIARSGVQGLKIAAEGSEAKNVDEFVQELNDVAKQLIAARPTAVSLPNGIRYVMRRVMQAKFQTSCVEELRKLTVGVADAFIENAKNATKNIGEIGARRIRDQDVLLTHCHSTAAVRIIKTAWTQGKRIEAFVTETRPRYQGRLTARILAKAGIPVTLIVDSAARFFMKGVDKVIVGADAVAANGAVVNKIGTSLIALAAHEARTLFFVAAETFKFSQETLTGELITIEERDPSEVVSDKVRSKLEGITVRNPAFDVTPPDYIDLIITEKGVIPPQAAFNVLKEEFGFP